MARSHNAPLGEREMLSTITKCSPTSLTISLSRGLDAVVAENVIKYLIDQLSVISNQLVCYLWFEDSKDEAFDMLLARSGLPGVPHQLLRCESQKAQHGVASNSSSSLSDWAWNDIAWGLSLVKSSIFFFFAICPWDVTYFVVCIENLFEVIEYQLARMVIHVVDHYSLSFITSASSSWTWPDVEFHFANHTRWYIRSNNGWVNVKCFLLHRKRKPDIQDSSDLDLKVQ